MNPRNENKANAAIVAAMVPEKQIMTVADISNHNTRYETRNDGINKRQRHDNQAHK
jgi:hypothetical protein